MSSRWWDYEAHPPPRQPEPGRQGPRHRGRHDLVPRGGCREGRAACMAFITRRQGWLFFPLLTLEGLNLHFLGLKHLLDAADPSRVAGSSSALIAARFALVLVPVFLFLPLGMAFAFIGVQLAVFGVYMGAAFAPNHKGMPIIDADAKLDFFTKQVRTSRNISRRLVGDLAHGRPELPGRAPPVPEHAAPAPRQGARDRARALPRRSTCPTPRRPAPVLRHRHRVPEPRRPARRATRSTAASSSASARSETTRQKRRRTSCAPALLSSSSGDEARGRPADAGRPLVVQSARLKTRWFRADGCSPPAGPWGPVPRRTRPAGSPPGCGSHRRRDRAVVREHVGAAVVRGDEAVALFGVEPLDGSSCHDVFFLQVFGTAYAVPR